MTCVPSDPFKWLCCFKVMSVIRESDYVIGLVPTVIGSNIHRGYRSSILYSMHACLAWPPNLKALANV